MKIHWLCSAKHRSCLVCLLIQGDLHLALTRVIREIVSGHPFCQEWGGDFVQAWKCCSQLAVNLMG